MHGYMRGNFSFTAYLHHHATHIYISILALAVIGAWWIWQKD
jgi:hypothetical protein